MHNMAQQADPFEKDNGSRKVIILFIIIGLLLAGVVGAIVWLALSDSDDVPITTDASSPLLGELGGGEAATVDATETTEAVAPPETTEAAQTTDPPATNSTTSGVEPGKVQDVAVVFSELLAVSERELGGDDPVGAIAALNDQIGGFPVAPGAVLRRFGVNAERDERERLTRINNRASVEYLTDLGVADVVALYQSESADYQLPQYEIEEGSDDNGTFTEIKFGDFGSHPDPAIEWAAMTVTVREDSGATLVRIFYTVMRPVENIDPSSPLGQLENSVDHPDDYWPVGAEMSAFTLDPYAPQPAPAISGAVQMAVASPLADENAELDSLITLAEESEVWVYDRSIEAGAFLDRTDGNEPYQFIAIGFAGDDQTFINFRFS